VIDKRIVDSVSLRLGEFVMGKFNGKYISIYLYINI
jgi:hypothetical protein